MKSGVRNVPEQCSYYYYENGYCCALKRDKEGYSSIDRDTVHRYCWGYHYEECPRYKNRNGSSGCYLTSACVESKGLPDNCKELTVLRSFRDGFLRSLPNGESEINEYYWYAPMIVAKIKEQSNAKDLFEQIYVELVLPCVELIEDGKNIEAYSKYRNYTRQLHETYLNA